MGAVGDDQPLEADNLRILEIAKPVLQPIRIGTAVVVSEGQQVATRVRGAGIARSGGTFDIGVHVQELEGRRGVPAPGSRTLVHHDHFEVAQRLTGQTLHQRWQGVVPLVGRDNHAYRGPWLAEPGAGPVKPSSELGRNALP